MARPAHTDQPFWCSQERSAETGGKTPPGAYKGVPCKTMCSGATERHVLSPAMSFQQTVSERGTEGSATSYALVQSAQLQDSCERCQQPRGEAHGSRVPSRQDLATSHKTL